MALRSVSLDELAIDDEGSFAHVALYGRLKQALLRSGHRFFIPQANTQLGWDRALFLNLTYWSGEASADVLCDRSIPADVIAHVAWHHLVGRELGRRAAAVNQTGSPVPPSAAALFFAESIASAFDLYLVGRLIPNAPDSGFITTQVPLMAERAQEAGLSEAAFAALLEDVAAEPERAFEDMRTLLLDTAGALLKCNGLEEAEAALGRVDGHRFAPLLHHFELSNWILYARAYAPPTSLPDPVVQPLDAILRSAPVALDWLAENCIDAAQPEP
jgi:hypothetical protein